MRGTRNHFIVYHWVEMARELMYEYTKFVQLYFFLLVLLRS